MRWTAMNTRARNDGSQHTRLMYNEKEKTHTITRKKKKNGKDRRKTIGNKEGSRTAREKAGRV